ncbi:MAG: phosphatidylglycerol lysyltransferase domain-containing protein [Candidatus Omnitrophica bacterium]|nr:phosphatidylglycerol lysyltransferase domain-containing protein [Candidatus Omnitrophota bacterium]MDD5575143.1 phosphatidylglycerol lysyltransferase domain-containing protein [Candidatus Omnitrophota bacterium]
MKLRPLRLSDRRLFERFLFQAPHGLSAYAFANIAVWNKLFSIRWAVVRGALCCFFEDSATRFMPFPPLGNPEHDVLMACFRFMEEKNRNAEISRIENVEEGELSAFHPGVFRHYKKCDEYIVRRRDMVSLAGGRYKHQRNLCHYFEKTCHPGTRPYRKGDRTAVLRLHRAWARERKSRDADPVYQAMLDDSAAVLDVMLGSFGALRMTAMVVTSGGGIRAFTSGFPLHDRLFCVNFEFGDLAMKGIAAYMFREFCRCLEDDEEINIMDAMGLDRIRRTKEMYHPVRTAGSYTVLLKGDHASLL